MSEWNDWLGKTEQTDELIARVPVARLAGLFDLESAPAEGQALPPLWHWMFFQPSERQSRLGEDGHPQRGGFLPPVPLPRRMWAGGKLQFVRALQVGAVAKRTSRIESIDVKDGRSGRLVFVKVQHEIADAQGVAISEQQDIVYRGEPAPGEPAPAGKPARTDEQFSRRIEPTPPMLFRYSALTYNGHRIHYDQPYATQVEGYPGLVVHGPLIATLLMELLRAERPQAQVTGYEFKALSPLFDTGTFEVCGAIEGNVANLWARGPQGQLAMQATATLK